MATQTTNLRLSKAEETDVILQTLEANNSNFDILDEKITEIETEIDGMELPIASSNVLGGIKVGNNLTIASDGKLSATVPTVSLSALGITATATELNYVDGVTSNIQTQLNAKLATNGSGASLTSLNASNLSSGTVPTARLPVATTSSTGVVKPGTNLTIDSDGTLHASTTSAVSSEALKVLIKRSSSTSYFPVLLTNTGDGTTEKQDNVYASTNNTVTLNPGSGALKATKFEGSGASLTSLNASNVSSGTLSSDRLPTVPIAKGGTGATTAAAALTNLGITATATELNKLDGVTATTAELNYVDGVTSNIQTQLNAKLATNGSGASLTSLNASNISSGTLNASRLPSIAASKITAGTLAGKVLANATSSATLTDTQVRNIQASTTDLTAGTSSLTTGNIYLVYE